MAVQFRDARLSHRFSRMKMFSNEGTHRGSEVHINVTALVDMMTVLVIFLIMQFSATGEMLFISKDMTMAGAEHAMEIERAPILALSSKGDLYFEGNIIEEALQPAQPIDMMIPSLFEQLEENKKLYQALDESRANETKDDDSAIVNVQIDETVDYALIKRVLFTCEKAGYGRIRLAVGNEAKPDTAREINVSQTQPSA